MARIDDVCDRLYNALISLMNEVEGVRTLDDAIWNDCEDAVADAEDFFADEV